MSIAEEVEMERRNPYVRLADLARRKRLGRTRRSVAHPPAPRPIDPIRLHAACLRDLSSRVRRRLEPIEWWADRHAPAGLVCATVFGRRALTIALPVGFEPASRAYVLIGYVLGDPVTERSIEHRPGPRAPREPGYPADIGLTPAHRTLLAGLPAEAQRLLQRPFEGTRIERCDGHDEGSDMVMVHLANAQWVSVAWGRRTIPPGHTPASAHWSLRVLVARVAARETVIVR